MAEEEQQLPEPPWLTAAVDQRLALMKDAMGPAFPLMGLTTSTVMTPLTEPEEDATPAQYEVWDKTCDRCGRHAPNTLSTGHVVREQHGFKIILTFGVCERCRKQDEG